jgi:hypothetical protein
MVFHEGRGDVSQISGAVRELTTFNVVALSPKKRHIERVV